MSAETQADAFATTHWSVVLRASDRHSAQAARALEELCETYWYPLYAYVRRRGCFPEDARDLTQEFFLRLLDGGWPSNLSPRKGRFRSFLLAAMKHFLANEWDRAKAIKRGGHVRFQPLDDNACESLFQHDSDAGRSPEDLYEQRWSIALLQKVLMRLREEADKAGRLPQFQAFEQLLNDEKPTITYAALAKKLCSTEGAVKMAVQRLRRRYGELLREEIANTVGAESEVEDELRYLVSVCGR